MWRREVDKARWDRDGRGGNFRWLSGQELGKKRSRFHHDHDAGSWLLVAKLLQIHLPVMLLLAF